MHIRDADALVESFSAGGGPAEDAGVPRGWFITAVAGWPVTGLRDVIQALGQAAGQAPPGQLSVAFELKPPAAEVRADSQSRLHYSPCLAQCGPVFDLTSMLLGGT
eukprot:SAG22_NODE_536_length_9364_cov_15.973988_9_plen_106_part_00